MEKAIFHTMYTVHTYDGNFVLVFAIKMLDLKGRKVSDLYYLNLIESIKISFFKYC